MFKQLKHTSLGIIMCLGICTIPADAQLAKTVLPDLLKCYANELIVHPNRSMMGLLKTMHMQHESLR